MVHRWIDEFNGWGFRCVKCGVINRVTAEERSNPLPPSWWNTECPGPRILSFDDIEWLTGTGRFAQ